jgi:hypothetical protein
LQPNIAWFHDLGEGTALQGFVGQHIQANGRWRENLDRSLRCGVAWQYPLFLPEKCSQQGVYFFVQGMAGYRSDFDRPGRSAAWEVVPGIHWHVSSNCWMSLGGSRYGLFTCSWQY